MPIRHRLPPFVPPAALLTLLRGVGQVVLQAHAGTGACVVAALALADPALACAALAGTAAAMLATWLTSARRGQGRPGGPASARVSRRAGPAEAIDNAQANATAVLAAARGPIAAAGPSAPPDAGATRAHASTHADRQRGLHGYSGTLAALAAVALIPDRWTAFAVALIAASVAGLLYRPVSRVLARVGGAAYSIPAVLATLLWLPFIAPATTSLAAPPHFPAWLAGAAVASLAQAVFAAGLLPGAVLLAGLAIASPRTACLAAAGALLASALLLAGGAAPAASATGLLGYNGALAAIALAPAGVRAALGAAALAAALHLLALRAGLPPLSAPFALAACFVSALRRPRDPRPPTDHDPVPRVVARRPPSAGAAHVVRPPR